MQQGSSPTTNPGAAKEQERDLQMPLGLHEPTHDPKGTEKVPIRVCGQPWYNGVVWSLVWSHTVWMLLI